MTDAEAWLYLLDSSVLINANNTFYPLDRVPEFWEWLVDQAETDHAAVPHE